jgi:hypothetical protein
MGLFDFFSDTSDQVHTCSTHGTRKRCKACEKDDRDLKEYCAELDASDRNFVPSTEWERKALELGWLPRLGDCRAMRGIGQGCGKCPGCLEFEATEGRTIKQFGDDFFERSERADYKRLKEKYGG